MYAQSGTKRWPEMNVKPTKLHRSQGLSFLLLDLSSCAVCVFLQVHLAMRKMFVNTYFSWTVFNTMLKPFKREQFR